MKVRGFFPTANDANLIGRVVEKVFLNVFARQIDHPASSRNRLQRVQQSEENAKGDNPCARSGLGIPDVPIS